MVMIAHKDGGKLLWADDGTAARNIYSEMPPRNRQHPNEKPVSMVEHFLRLHSVSHNTILDPFMGSGTTGVACVKLGRKFIGIELEPKYFDIACQRIDDAYKQPDMFVEQPKKTTPEQDGFDL